jgi:hypothetical protein
LTRSGHSAAVRSGSQYHRVAIDCAFNLWPKLVEQCLRLLEIQRVEPLGKAP